MTVKKTTKRIEDSALEFFRLNIWTCIFVLTSTVFLIAFLFLNTYSIEKESQLKEVKNNELARLSQKVFYLHESLIRSVRMALLTDSSKWEGKYLTLKAQLDLSMKTMGEVLEYPHFEKFMSSIIDDRSHLERKILKKLKNGKRKEAFEILNGGEYDLYKRVFVRNFSHLNTFDSPLSRLQFLSEQAIYLSEVLRDSALLAVSFDSKGALERYHAASRVQMLALGEVRLLSMNSPSIESELAQVITPLSAEIGEFEKRGFELYRNKKNAQGRLALEASEYKLKKDIYENKLRNLSELVGLKILEKSNLGTRDLFKQNFTLLLASLALLLGWGRIVFLLFMFRYKEQSAEQRASNLSLDLLKVETDLSGNIIFANERFCNILKYSSSGVCKVNFWNRLDEKSSEMFSEKYLGLLVEGNVWSGKIICNGEEGSVCWMEAAIYKRFDAHGSIIGYCVVGVNIASQEEARSAQEIIRSIAKKVEMENDLLEKKEQSMRTSKLACLGELVAEVGHEINNPLAMGIGNLTRLKNSLRTEKLNNLKIFDDIEKVEIANERIRKIVDGLRIYARSNSEKDESISLGKAIKETVFLVAEIYEKEGVSIRVENSHLDLYSRGRFGQLQQILMNLISNAKDATEGQESREILLSLRERGDDMLELSVRDNGSGMSDSTRGEVLKPLFTTKDLGKGTGIGLSVVNELSGNMGGWIEIKSELGEGSEFSVILPSISGPLHDESGNYESRSEEKSEVQRIHGTVLVVDDEEGIRELLVEHLENLGLIVEEAADGEIALEKVRKKKYDYICTDMKMPRVSGTEFIKNAKDLPNGNTFYFIVSGGVDAKSKGLGGAAQENIADGYIEKPFTEESILEVMGRYKQQ